MQRVILLGASNLTLAFPMLYESLRASLEGPVEVVAAHGHGRSFGMTSRVLFRSLPGISESQLWHDLTERTRGDAPPLNGTSTFPLFDVTNTRELTPGIPSRTFALLTDVGNDLLYGAEPQAIIAWVEACLVRLAGQQAEIVMTLLPLESVFRMSAVRYHATKQLFFPGSGVSWPRMQQRSRTLNECLRDLGNKFGAAIVEPKRDWYGFDPIHIRRNRRRDVWQSILQNWPSLGKLCRMSRPSTRRAIALWRLRPNERHLFGRLQLHTQPVLDDAAGMSLWLY